MEIICTRPGCIKPKNFFGDLDDRAKIRTVQQRYCANCGMPLVLADRYIPSRLLGQGGFGAAFLACDRHKPKMPLCVVKQFQPSGNLDPDELKIAQNLFEREAVVLEELGHRHPQIPNLYAFFTPIVSNTQGTNKEQYFYLAQEFIDGQDLETELEAKGAFSEEEVTAVLTEMLKILDFVHQNKVIHRDIKPSNIIRNQQGVLYLLDFGAVKQVAIAGANNQKSTVIYSTVFAPSEQMSGLQVFPSTDLYALAVTCIALLTDKPVEELYDPHQSSWNWLNFAPQTSDRLTAILTKMLQSIPAQRFQSATEVLEALKIAQSPTPKPTPKSHQPIVHKPPVPPVKKSQFSAIEVLSSAAFAGFEGALLYLGLTSLLSVSGISLGILGMVMGGVVFALYRRIIEKSDLAIFAVVSAGIIAFIPALQGSLLLSTILTIAAVSSAGTVAIAAFFRLVYQLLSSFL